MTDEKKDTPTDEVPIHRGGRYARNCIAITPGPPSRSSTTNGTSSYSLDDPDIQLVLQDLGFLGVRPEAHFMLAPEPTTASRVDVFRQSFGVSVITYPSGDHSVVTPAIQELSDSFFGDARKARPAGCAR
ncbi:MAG: hypothetical protein H0T19_05925 [Thermoleophilaceae bacterium]|nr:hypothetical protein [Thermoleophilaceae bacterium]